MIMKEHFSPGFTVTSDFNHVKLRGQKSQRGLSEKPTTGWSTPAVKSQIIIIYQKYTAIKSILLKQWEKYVIKKTLNVSKLNC